MSVCLSVSFCISQKAPVQILPNFLYMLPMDWAQSFFDGNAIRCGFVDDSVFSHNRVNGQTQRQ